MIAKKTRIIPIAMLCALVLAVPVFASETGSISVTMQTSGETVEGGSFVLYKVADDSYTEAFEGCDPILLDELEKAETSEKFSDWIDENKVDAYAEVGNPGTFTDLSDGVYMVAQGTAPDGYEPINAFLVTVPTYEDGAWVYDVNATPKTSPVPDNNEPTDEPTSEPTDEPTAEPTSEPTDEPTAEPTSEPIDEPTSEPIDEPTSEPEGSTGTTSIGTTNTGTTSTGTTSSTVSSTGSVKTGDTTTGLAVAVVAAVGICLIAIRRRAR